MKNVGVLGLGNFGFALLLHLDRKNIGSSYILRGFSRNVDKVSHIQDRRKHPTFLVEKSISATVELYSDLRLFIDDLDCLILAISSNAIKETVEKIAPFVTKQLQIVNTSKALDHQTGKPFSTLINDYFDNRHVYSIFAGATMASDIGKGLPASVNIASANNEKLLELVSLFHSPNLTVVATEDLIGVEYAAAFKNVISIWSGIFQGLGYPTETVIYAATQIAGEVEDLVVNKLGGKRETFSLSSPCWGNDVWMSCTANTRNREVGILLGQGNKLEDLRIKMLEHKKTVEGLLTINVLNKVASLAKYKHLRFLFDFINGKVHLLDLHKVLEGTSL